MRIICSLFHKVYNILPLLCLVEIEGGIVLSDAIEVCVCVCEEVKVHGNLVKDWDKLAIA